VNIETLGGRRYTLTLGCGVACSFLLWFAKLSDASFATIILGTVGVYIAGNTYQKVKTGSTS
jgi:hypothetical protein